MDEVDSISVAVAGIDINNVEALDSRRLVAFINHYVTTTVSFLNHFSTLCETRLEKMHYQLLKLEQRLTLLECKLSSGSEGLSLSSTLPNNETTSQSNTESNTSETDENVTANSRQNVAEEEDGHHHGMENNGTVENDSKGNEMSLKDDPRYQKYYKMAAVGVPIPAIKLKMASEGVTADIISV